MLGAGRPNGLTPPQDGTTLGASRLIGEPQAAHRIAPVYLELPLGERKGYFDAIKSAPQQEVVLVGD